MRLGSNIHRYQIVEWSQFYIDYNILKTTHKSLVRRSIEQGVNSDLSDLIAAAQKQIVAAHHFFATTYHGILSSLNAIENDYGIKDLESLKYANTFDCENLTAAFRELKVSLKRLQWFGLINFNKIHAGLRRFLPAVEYPSGQAGLDEQCLGTLVRVAEVIERLYIDNSADCNDKDGCSLLQRTYEANRVPSIPIMRALNAIIDDKPSALQNCINSISDDSEISSAQLSHILIDLLQYSCHTTSMSCVQRVLLPRMSSLSDFGDVLHRLLVKIGQRHALQTPSTKEPSAIPHRNATPTLINVVVRFIGESNDQIYRTLFCQDKLGQLPIHCASWYGLMELCDAILQRMTQAAKSIRPSSSPVLIEGPNGYSALDIAILTGNLPLVRLFLKDQSLRVSLLPGRLLTLAMKIGYPEVVRALCASGVDLSYEDRNDETALFLAIRSGTSRLVEILFETPPGHESLDVNACESVRGWTPLILASIQGNKQFVDMLLQAGADTYVQDIFGWTAKDHAAFQGWLPLARMLAALETKASPDRLQLRARVLKDETLRRANLPCDRSTYPSDKTAFDSGHSEVFVNLGPLDTYKPVVAVDLGALITPEPYTPQREADFEVQISAMEEGSPTYSTQLPILEDDANCPFRFTTKDATNFKLAFRILYSDLAANKGDRHVGTAIAMLESLKQGLGSRRESLGGKV